MLDPLPIGHLAQPLADRFGPLVAFACLASDEASYITGTTLFVDGGLMVNAGGL